VDQTLDDLLDAVRRATAMKSSPGERLSEAVRAHVLFHARNRNEAFISRSELRFLTPANLRRNVAKRNEYEGMFRTLLTDGISAGVFHVPDVRLTAMAILGMCSSVVEWFSERGRLRAEAVADYYVEMTLRLVSRDGEGPAARANSMRSAPAVSIPSPQADRSRMTRHAERKPPTTAAVRSRRERPRGHDAPRVGQS
jgi:hypothetical protein